MNIQELMHLSEYKLNIVVILFNNNGCATIEKTTTRYHGRCIASNRSNGIVNFKILCSAYNVDYVKISDAKELDKWLKKEGPIFVEIEYSSDDYIGPRLMENKEGILEQLRMVPVLQDDKVNKDLKEFLE